MDKCEKHDEVMDRLFTEIHTIKESQVQIITKIDAIAIFKDEIHKLMFGNGHEGLVSKIRRVASQLNLHWCLISAVLLAIIGYSIRLFWIAK